MEEPRRPDRVPGVRRQGSADGYGAAFWSRPGGQHFLCRLSDFLGAGLICDDEQCVGQCDPVRRLPDTVRGAMRQLACEWTLIDASAFPSVQP